MNRKYQKGFTIFELLMTVLILAGVGGWIANVYKMCKLLGDEVTAWFLMRLAGIFIPPLGAVLGFF